MNVLLEKVCDYLRGWSDVGRTASAHGGAHGRWYLHIQETLAGWVARSAHGRPIELGRRRRPVYPL